MMKYIFSIGVVATCFSYVASAQADIGSVTNFNRSSDSAKANENAKENESLLENIDSEFGGKRGYHSTLDENSRLSVSYDFSSDFRDLSSVVGFSVDYLRRYGQGDFWYGVRFKRTAGRYDALADELTTKTSAHVDSDSLTKRSVSIQTLNQIGVGGSYRFRLIPFSKNPKFFEHIIVFLDYTTHTDGETGLNYTGYTLSSEYDLVYRLGTKFFVDGKLGYEISSLERVAKSDEKKSDRSLIFGHLFLGVGLGYYF